jgi:hypothetical protein
MPVSGAQEIATMQSKGQSNKVSNSTVTASSCCQLQASEEHAGSALPATAGGSSCGSGEQHQELEEGEILGAGFEGDEAVGDEEGEVDGCEKGVVVGDGSEDGKVVRDESEEGELVLDESEEGEVDGDELEEGEIVDDVSDTPPRVQIQESLVVHTPMSSGPACAFSSTAATVGATTAAAGSKPVALVIRKQQKKQLVRVKASGSSAAAACAGAAEGLRLEAKATSNLDHGDKRAPANATVEKAEAGAVLVSTGGLQAPQCRTPPSASVALPAANGQSAHEPRYNNSCTPQQQQQQCNLGHAVHGVTPYNSSEKYTAPVLVAFDTNVLLESEGRKLILEWAQLVQKLGAGVVQLLMPQVRRWDCSRVNG